MNAAAIENAATQYDADAEPLSSDTFLCRADDSSAVVLKRLEDDCLHQGRLHPKIRERLSLVRGVAHPRLATLRGVERSGGVPFLVWSFVAGEPLEDVGNLDELSAVTVCRSLVAAVRTLHSRGVVHGAIHGRNVIRSDDGEIWLTHVSPYLYDDPAVDVSAVVETIEAVAGRCPEFKLSWGDDPAVTADLEAIDAVLTRLRARPEAEEPQNGDALGRPPRWRWVLVSLAIVTLAAGGGFLASKRLGHADTGIPLISHR